MDFSKILSFINSWIPNDIAGFDTLYVIAGVLAIILVVLIVVTNRKKTPPRELLDLVPEEVDIEALKGGSEEDAFVPSAISDEPQEIYVSEEEPQAVQVEEPAFIEEKIIPDELQQSPGKTSVSTRKKRESKRNGKKVSKADFADFSGQRLLIAEDNLINQKVINGVLNESGIDVVMADDGQEVLDILEKDNNFEIILMDAHMPRVDGFEATRRIRENSSYDHIAVVALSGDTASDDIRHMREAGMEENLEKPLKMDMLYDIMSMYYTMDEPKKADSISEPQVEELEISVNINDLPSLDYDLGLGICGGDEEMYRQLLKEFFISYKDSPKKLRDALVQKDYHEAQSILIDLKGTASNLGAKQFIYVVDRFIKELSQNNTSSYAELFKDYQSNLLILLKSIQNVFKV